MAKTKISEFNANPALNTDIDSINISEGCAPSGINDAIRELMSQLKDWQSGTSNDPYVVGSSGSLTLNQGTANTVPYLNGSKVVTSGTALSFDGTNLGLGVTPSAWGTLKGFDIVGGASFGSAYNSSYLAGNAYFNGTNWIYRATDEAAMYSINNTNGSHAWNTAASGTAGNAITFTQAMTLDASGNLLVGTTSSTYSSAGRGLIEVNGTNESIVALRRGGSTSGFLFASSSEFRVAQTENLPLTFYTNNTERARIDSSGNLLVGTTSGGSGKLRVSGSGDAFLTSYSSPSAGYFFSSNSGDANCVEIYQGRFNKVGLSMHNNNTGTVTQIDFAQGGVSRGSITTNNSTTAYNTSSDYRLKENIQPMTGALARVALLKPCTYKWKEDGSDGEGFIAHELQAVVPNAVTGEKDAVREDGSIKPQGIDTSFLVATLTAAIQELKAEFDAYKATHP